MQLFGRRRWLLPWSRVALALALLVVSIPDTGAAQQVEVPKSSPVEGSPLVLNNGAQTEAVSALSILAASLPTGFVETTAFSGLTFPTVVRFASDGRVFVAEKGGYVKVFDSLTDSTPTTVIDVTASTYSWWDRGLLGMALDPGFPAEPWIYVFYTEDIVPYNDACPSPPGATSDGCLANGRLARFQVNASNQVVGGEQILLSGHWCQQFPSHSMGTLDFGADGALYASAGDGASFIVTDYGQNGGNLTALTPRNPCGDPPVPIGSAQTPPTAQGGALRSQDVRTSGDPVTFDGSILRINRATGAAFAGNPLLGGDPGDDRIVAHGLRNPFRFAVRPGTSELWIGDVGWRNWEEINRHQSPASGVANFGWPCYEGVGRQSGYDAANLAICETLYTQVGAVTAPYFTYSHNSELLGCPAGDSSVTGLEFYTGTSYPAEFSNALFFADYSRGCIWVMHPGGNGLPNPSNITLFASSIGAVGLEAGPSGDIFAVDHLGGSILRYSFESVGNQAPLAVASANPSSGTAPLQVNFDGTGSSDPDGDPLSYSWDLDGNGTLGDSTSPTPSFNYTAGGDRTVTLHVTDGRGGIGTAQVLVQVAATGVDGSVRMPGAAGSYIVAPDAARLDVAGDLDVRADVALVDWSPATNLKFISNYTATGGYELMLDRVGRGLRIAWRQANGVQRVRNATVALPATDGQRLQLRAVIDVNNGTSGHTVTFYYRTDTTRGLGDNTGWTQLGSAVTASGVSNVAPSSSQMVLGAHVNGIQEFWAGNYYQALILNGIAGTPVANPDFRTTTQLTSTPPNYAQWQDTVTNPWTLLGASTYSAGGGGPNRPPVATISTPAVGTTWQVNQQFAFTGMGSDLDETLGPAALSWALVLHHCSSPTDCHAHPLQQWTGVTQGSFTAPDHEYPSHLELTLTARDSAGAAGSASLRLDPRTVDLTFQSNPTGLQLTVGASSAVAPFTRTVIVGSIVSVSANSPQTLGGSDYVFSSWSDGGAATHNLVAPATPVTYTASYTTGGAVVDGFVRLGGVAGSYIVAPDAARLDVAGDLDVRADVALVDWSPATNLKFISNYTATGGYELMLDRVGRGLRIAWRQANGVQRVRNATVALPATDGQRLQLRAVIDVNNGTSGHTVTFYYRTDTTRGLGDNTGWTQLGSAVTASGVSNVAPSSSQMVLGAHVNGIQEFWAGNYYQALILNGIAGTPVANPDFRTTTQLTSTPPNYSQWRDTSTNPWTLQGGATYTPG